MGFAFQQTLPSVLTSVPCRRKRIIPGKLLLRFLKKSKLPYRDIVMSRQSHLTALDTTDPTSEFLMLTLNQSMIVIWPTFSEELPQAVLCSAVRGCGTCASCTLGGSPFATRLASAATTFAIAR
jgi:hypothetical protein